MADHVCPVWVGYLLASPLRKLIDNPVKKLSPYVRRGMTVLDVGCAMGFFSLPMARMVGSKGKVICVDLQEKMVQKLYRRAKKRNIHSRIEARVCESDHLNIDDLSGKVDFILASAIVHEVPDTGTFFSELFSAAKNGAKLLVVEPGKHVSLRQFKAAIDEAEDKGFTLLEESGTRRRLSALLQKKSVE